MPKLKAIPSRLYRSFGPAPVGAVAFAFATIAQDAKKLAQGLRRRSTTSTSLRVDP
jgi:hypothetical protein